MLAALLLPALASARQKSHRVACLFNLRQTGIAVYLYSQDNDGRIPYGPLAPPFTSPANFYPSTGSPTSLLSLQSGAPVGLGLLLKDYVAQQPKIFFCPGADQRVDADAELAKVSEAQAQGSYFYRHGGVTQLFYTPSEPVPHLILDDLGTNRIGRPIRALAVDSLFLSPPSLVPFGVKTRTHHQRQAVGVLFADGHASSLLNTTNRFTVDVTNYADLYDAFNRILRVLEGADEEP